MEGSVDLGYQEMRRPGNELAISRSQVRRPNHYTAEPRGWHITAACPTAHFHEIKSTFHLNDIFSFGAGLHSLGVFY